MYLDSGNFFFLPALLIIIYVLPKKILVQESKIIKFNTI